MTMLDKDKLEELEEEFEQHPDGIELVNFVWLMKSALKVDKNDEYDLIYGLWRLFSDIDINGDLHMEWTEFTQYIIDTVMKNSTNNDYLQMLKDKNKINLDMPLNKIPLGKRKITLLDLSKLCVFKRFYLSNKGNKVSFPNEMKFGTTIFDPKVLLKIPYSTKEYVMGIVNSKELPIVATACEQLCRQNKIWYIEKYCWWITAGEDNVLRQWNTKSQPIKLKTYFIESKESLVRDPNSALMIYEFKHPDTIMDVIEIYSPHLLATAWMDHKFRLISLKEQNIIAIYHEHKTGIRKLSYCHLYNSWVASVGHENYINVWSPEISLYKAYLGKLEGHSSTVVDSQFIDQTPFLVSMDIKENVRIWDIRTMDCLQIITRNSSSASQPEGLILFPYLKHKFCIYGKNIITYTNEIDAEDEVDDPKNKQKVAKALQKSTKKKEEDNIWIAVEFNYYLLQIMVVTRKEIRFYDSSNGILIKVFNDFLKKKNINDICSFSLDDRHRKFYIGDIFGNINLYNASSGVHIKSIENVGYSLSSVLNKVSSEVTSLYFTIMMGSNLLISSSWNSAIKIYDEDDTEESILLREAYGGINSDMISKEDDWMKIITSLAFDEHLGLVATGSNVGKIAVWDIENLKIEAFMAGNSKDISSLAFISPYPLLVAGCSDGLIWIYGVRGIDPNYKYTCLLRIENTDQNILITQLPTPSSSEGFSDEKLKNNEVTVSVNSLIVRKSGPMLETDTTSIDIYK